MSEISTSIRRANVADAAVLATFAAHCFSQAFAADNRPDDLLAHLQASYGEAQQRSELQDPDTITLLASSGVALIGFAQVGHQTPPACVSDTTAAELVRFYVDAAAHGRGVAQQLMAAAFSAAREFDARRIWLGVWERNPRAIAFYKKCGYRDVGSKDFFVGSDRQTDRVLLAELPG